MFFFQCTLRRSTCEPSGTCGGVCMRGSVKNVTRTTCTIVCVCVCVCATHGNKISVMRVGKRVNDPLETWCNILVMRVSVNVVNGLESFR
jgi:hypothetical protein